jgi:hypothetical protein
MPAQFADKGFRRLQPPISLQAAHEGERTMIAVQEQERSGASLQQPVRILETCSKNTILQAPETGGGGSGLFSARSCAARGLLTCRKPWT